MENKETKKKTTVKKVIANIVLVCGASLFILWTVAVLVSMIGGIITTIQDGEGLKLLAEVIIGLVFGILVILFLCLIGWALDNK